MSSGFSKKIESFLLKYEKPVTVPGVKLQMLHFREKATSERTVNVPEELSV